MRGPNAYPLEIFYDGSCAVCSSEMETYRRRNPRHRLLFIDISSGDFSAEDYGRSQEQFMAELHVRDAEGHFFTGVDAFVALWGAFPRGSFFRLLAGAVSLPGLNRVARLAYRLFARNRHRLPKRDEDCPSGRCTPKP